MKSIYLIQIRFFVLIFISNLAGAQDYNYYFGNIHAHTAYSDGNKDKATTHVNTPAGSFDFAKKSDNFNFLGISEHNHKSAGMKLASYSLGLQQAGQANDNGHFVCMYGMEFGVIKNGGHVLIYGVDKLIGWDPNNFDIECGQFDYDALWNIIADFPGAFATLAHPENADFNNLLTKPYNLAADKVICGVAYSTGPAFAKNTDYISKPSKMFNSYFRGLLAAGYNVGPTIDHDNHYLTFGRMAASRTVVLARKLDRDSIMAAYREMRFYASADPNAKVKFTINGFVMGQHINTMAAASIRIQVTDPDAGDDVKSIKIMYGEPGSKKLSELLKSVSDSNSLEFSHDQNKGKTCYYYAEIIQKDGDKIVTSPIWVRKL